MTDVAHKHPPAAESRLARSGQGVVVPPSGPAAAVLLAAGIAACALGLLTVMTAASESVSSALTLSDRVGDLSGVTTLTAVVFFGAWGSLAVVWRRADPPLMRCAVASGVLTALGLACTFPPVVNALGG